MGAGNCLEKDGFKSIQIDLVRVGQCLLYRGKVPGSGLAMVWIRVGLAAMDVQAIGARFRPPLARSARPKGEKIMGDWPAKRPDSALADSQCRHDFLPGPFRPVVK